MIENEDEYIQIRKRMIERLKKDRDSINKLIRRYKSEIKKVEK